MKKYGIWARYKTNEQIKEGYEKRKKKYDMWTRYKINEQIKEGYEKRMEKLNLIK